MARGTGRNIQRGGRIVSGPQLSWLATGLVAAVTALCYWRTVHPGVGPYLDSVEYQITVQVLGVSHPPGYPLYTLLGRLFVTLVPIGNPAFRLNLMSAACSVGTVALVQRLVWRLTHNVPVSLLGALALGGAVRFWYQATYTELYPLYSLFVVATFLLLVAWRQTRRPWLYFLSAAVYALSFGVNAPAIALLPAWLWAVLTTDHRMLLRPRNLALTVLIVLLAAAQYLYVPLRAFAGPAFCNYCPETWGQVSAFLTGREWWGIAFGVQSRYWLQRWADTGYQLVLQFWPLGVMLGAVGLWNLLRRQPRLAGTFILGLAGPWFFVVTYDVVDWSDFMSPVYVLYAPLVALGAYDGWVWLTDKLAPWGGTGWRLVARWSALTLVMLLGAGLLAATYRNNYSLVDQSDNTAWHGRARELLSRMEPNAWLITPPTATDGFAQSWALRFVSWSEELAPDMQVVYLPGYDTPGPAPGYLRWEEAAPHLDEHPVYVIELNDERLHDYVLLPISLADGWTVGYRVVGQRTAEGVTPWVSPERWAEIEGEVVAP